jgi:hypothetical protein
MPPKRSFNYIATIFHVFPWSKHKCGPNGPCLCEDIFKIISQMFDKTIYATLIEMNMVMPL